MVALVRTLSPVRSICKNDSSNWQAFDVAVYLEKSYVTLIPEDTAITKAIIQASITNPLLYKRLGTAKLALDICVGGVPRTAGLIHPFMVSEGLIVLGDIGMQQLQHTAQVIAQVSQGNLGIWRKHQSDMARHDPLWANAIHNACLQSMVCQANIFTLPRAKFDIVATSFGPESLTEDYTEYQQAIQSWLSAAKPGSIAIMTYIIGSSGYTAGRHFPAVAVYPKDVERVVRNKLLVVEHCTVPASGHMRDPHDQTSYEGMGLLIGLVKN